MQTTCVAKRVYKLTSDAPDSEALINLAEEISGGLDSHDLGDAMGAFIEYIDGQKDEDGWPVSDTVVVGNGFTVIVAWHWELFEWGTPLPDGPFDHLKPSDFDGLGGNNE